MREIARSVRDFLPMTGTDQDKSPMDLWSQLDAVEPGWWGTWFEFGLAFAAGKRKERWIGKGRPPIQYWDMTGSSNAKVLHDRLRYVRLRRTLADVGIELPPQTRIRYPMELDEKSRQEYDKVLAEYRAFVRQEEAPETTDEQADPEQEAQRFKTSKGKRMAYIMRLRQISSRGRPEGTADLVSELIGAGKRPIVFAYFVPALEALRDGLKARGYRVGYIRGGVSQPERDAIRHAFNAGKLDVIVGQTEAAGVSMNLQDASDTTVTHDLTYKILDIKQTEGRVYRSGQKRPTFHYYCFGENTRDAQPLDVLFRKMASKQAVDEGVDEELEDELLKAIEADFFG